MTASSNSRIFLLLFLATLAAFGPFVTDFYLPTLPEQTTDFHTSPAMVQLGLSNIMWGLAAGQLLVGPISDRRGRKKPLFWCLVLFAVTTAVAAAATEIHVFLVMRFFEGLGAAGAIVLSRSIAADRYTGRELGSFMGVMGAIQGIAPVTAPMLGALIADAAGWRGIFWILFGWVWCLPSSHCLFSWRRSRARGLTVPNVQATVRSARASVKVPPNSLRILCFAASCFSSSLLQAFSSDIFLRRPLSSGVTLIFRPNSMV